MATLEELYGKERATEMRRKMRLAAKRRPSRKGKTWEELYGPERAEEHRARWAEARQKSWHAQGETAGATYEQLYGPKRAEEIKQRISDTKRGRKYSDAHRKAISEGIKAHWAKRRAGESTDPTDQNT